jgi:hypothetical protein
MSSGTEGGAFGSKSAWYRRTATRSKAEASRQGTLTTCPSSRWTVKAPLEEPNICTFSPPRNTKDGPDKTGVASASRLSKNSLFPTANSFENL